jgi:glyoxylase-like metal-dependent hydrolase (beta-lactamase superfamily II)
VLSWSPSVKAASGADYVINGYVNSQNMIERVETWLGNAILGDMHIQVTYSDYKDMGGAKVPTRIVQTRGGLPFFETTVTAARANPTDIVTLLTPPAPAGRGGGGAAAGPGGAGGAGARGAAAAPGGRGAAPAGAPPAGGRGAAGAPPAQGARGGGAPAAAPGAAPGGQRGGGPGAPATASSEKLADGVWRITGGYVSLAIELDDYIMVLEGGDSDARALAIIAETKRVIPNKPIRYVMNTHPHSDHAGGLSAFVAEGATIVTHENNKEFFENAYSTPRTLLTDSLARAQAEAAAKKQTLRPKVEGVGDRKVYRDNNHSVELYHMKVNLGTKPVPEYTPHSDGWLIAYLPKEKILFQGDFSINPGQPANDHVMQVLMPNLDRLKLDFEKYVPVHATNPDVVQTRAEVMKAVGRQ